MLIELADFEEVEMPYNFNPGCHVKYIMLKDGKPTLYSGGKFQRCGEDCIWLESKINEWSVETCSRYKDGSICHESRFFIPKGDDNDNQEEQDCKETRELQATIQYQQDIIDKLTDRLREVELQKSSILDEKGTLEELLHQNQMNLQRLSHESHEQIAKIKQYEEVIHNLIHSR